MQDPELYRKANVLPRRDAIEMLSKYINLVQWRNTEDETVLDVGCAGGDVTWEFLKPLLPSAARVFAADISPEMISYASKTYPDVDFFVLDIGTKNLPNCWANAFDHVFSFYCLHWVQDQRQAMQNIYNMLKPKGSLFTYYVGTSPYHDAFFNTSQLTKWKTYISDEDAHKYISPYQHKNQVEERLYEILIDVGFNVSICKVINKQFKYSNFDTLKNLLTGINPHYAKIPENLRDDYINDTLQELFKLKNSQGKNIYENIDEIITPFTLIFIVATKGEK